MQQEDLNMWLCLLCGCIAVIIAAAAEWRYQRNRKCLSATGNPAEVTVTRILTLLCFFFERERMAWAASLCDTDLPIFLRVPLLRVIACFLGADVSEARNPLEAYTSVSDFFSRELREGAREIQSDDAGGLVSPVDAAVLAVGMLGDSSSRVAQVEVKGTTYSIAGLLGVDPSQGLSDDSVLLYAAFHLGPGDYHRFHSPARFTVREGRRFAGEGLPVMPLVTGYVSDVFSMNERLVLSGEWDTGQMHMAAVGAAHVRGIFLDFNAQLSKDLVATSGRYYLDGQCIRSRLPKTGATVSAGEMLGGFRLGSAVVVVCEAPKGSQWRIAAGDRVQVGQALLA
jgi:phosphatidylserine decarboxylase